MASIDEQMASVQTPAPIQPSQPLTVATDTFLGTPQKKSDLRGQLNNLAIRRQALSTRRLLFRKVEKAFDRKDFELAQLRQKNEALKLRLETAQPSRRKKVAIDQTMCSLQSNKSTKLKLRRVV